MFGVPTHNAVYLLRMSKAIKSGLKKCKELLVAKDYDGVLRETNGILSAEPLNYSALIFRGKVFSERQDYARAEKDFRAAVDAEPKKPLGFQGRARQFLFYPKLICLF